MKSELRVSSPTWKVTITVGATVAVIVITAMLVFREEFKLILLGGSGLVGFAAFVIIRKWQKRIGHDNDEKQLDLSIKEQQLRLITFQANKAQLEAGFLVMNRTQRAIYSEAGKVRIIEAQATSQFALPGSGQDESIDFFEAMSDCKTVYAIIGPQRVGKSYIAMHISDYLARWQMGQNMVIGTKAESGEWPNCEQHIGEPYISKALARLIELIDDRHKMRTKPRINVFLDDWINTAAICGDLAEQFFVRAATDMLSAGIVPYFLLQSDSKADWGTKHGAMLKNNFAKMILKAPRRKGKLIPAEATGAILWPGESEPIHVDLPRGLPELNSVEADAVRSEQIFGSDQQFVEDCLSGMSQNKLIEKYFSGMRRTDAIEAVKAKRAIFGL